ncbi:hypothetical protein BKA69DRAFT_810188 [Paraphysoderma sedebokerense]|nr:hypothetical protein BKA69DRAFT_810188 [Paraphysoderma sedebokerense]
MLSGMDIHEQGNYPKSAADLALSNHLIVSSIIEYSVLDPLCSHHRRQSLLRLLTVNKTFAAECKRFLWNNHTISDSEEFSTTKRFVKSVLQRPDVNSALRHLTLQFSPSSEGAMEMERQEEYKKLIEKIYETAKRLESVDLTYSCYKVTCGHLNKLLESHGAYLTKLKIGKKSSSKLHNLDLEKLKNKRLRDFKWARDLTKENQEKLVDLIHHLPHLRSLDVECQWNLKAELSTAILALRHLRHLRLTTFPRFDPSCAGTMAPIGLESLELHNFQLTAKDLQHIEAVFTYLGRCPNFKSLTLSSIDFFQNYGLLNLLPNLTHLSLSRINSMLPFQNQRADMEGVTLPKLTHLYLSDIMTTDISFERFLSSINHLQHLRLNNVRMLQLGWLTTLVVKFKSSLQVLDISPWHAQVPDVKSFIIGAQYLSKAKVIYRLKQSPDIDVVQHKQRVMDWYRTKFLAANEDDMDIDEEDDESLSKKQGMNFTIEIDE